MKILVCHRPGGAFGYITDGWINAFKDAKFKVERWDGMPSSWNKFKPDLYIGCSGHRQHIPSHHLRKTKVAIHVNPYCARTIKPSINEPPITIQWVETMRPDVVFGYGFEEHEQYWSFWQKRSNLKWIPMPTAGDVTLYKPGYDKSLDFAYVGGYWDYKAHNLDKYLIPLLDTQLSFKVRGWGWDKYKECTTSEKVQLLQSAIVGPCVAEPHTTKHGIDLPERVFKVILSGAIAVHDPVAGGEHLLETVIWTEGPKQYKEAVYKILGEPEKVRRKIWKSQYAEILSSHTYHHRLAKLLEKLGFRDQAKTMLKCLGRFHEIQRSDDRAG